MHIWQLKLQTVSRRKWLLPRKWQSSKFSKKRLRRWRTMSGHRLADALKLVRDSDDAMKVVLAVFGPESTLCATARDCFSA